MFKILLIAVLVLIALVNAQPEPYDFNNGDGCSEEGWAGFSPGIYNWRAATQETILDANNVGSVVKLWEFTITSALLAAPPTAGGFSSVPVSTGDRYLYATDWSGMLRAFDRSSGIILWSFNLSTYLHTKVNYAIWQATEFTSRASPSVVGNNLYVTTRAGAYVISFNRFSGAINWATSLSSNPFAYITASPRYYNNLLYVGVASAVEDAASSVNITTPFRGQFVALNAENGHVVWTFYTIPASVGIDQGWQGATVWSSLAPIDNNRGQIIISTGNLYGVPQYIQNCLDWRYANPGLYVQDPCRHPLDYSESIVALDLQTGEVRWTRPIGLIEVSTTLCGIFLAGVTFRAPDAAQCPPADLGHDYDFGQSPIFIPGGHNTPDGQDALVVCQKSGVCYCLSAQSGEVHWAVQAAPGGGNGGFEFSSASDGVNLYYGDTNGNALNFTLQNGQVLVGTPHFGAIQIATGRILWETPVPIPYPGPGLLQGVTFANGVLYGGTIGLLENTPSGPNFGPNNGGVLYALDARNGQIKLNLKLDTKSCYPPSIVNGVLYVACGYAYDEGLFFPPNSLYAYALPGHHVGGGYGW